MADPAVSGFFFNIILFFCLLLVSYFLSYRVLSKILLNISMAGGTLYRYLYLLLTLPGIIVHELSHAAGFLVSGYRVKEINFGVRDMVNGGYCRAGARYFPFTVPVLADAVASLSPFVSGGLIMIVMLRWLRIDYGIDVTSVYGFSKMLAGILKNVDYSDWRTYLFFYLSMTVGSQVSPSKTDLKYVVPNTVLITLVAFALVMTCSFNEALFLRLKSALSFFKSTFVWLNTVLIFGIAMTVVAITVFGIVQLPFVMLRKK